MSIVIAIPDLHLPYIDKSVLDDIFQLIVTEKPDYIVQLGDLND